MTEYNLKNENEELLIEESYEELDQKDEENETLANIYTNMMNSVAYKTR